MAALLVGLCGATAACADPDFRADAEDARRLDLLRSVRAGDPPVPAQLAKGRICADDVKARRPPPPDCGLPPP